MKLAFILGRFCPRPGLRRPLNGSGAFAHIWKSAFRQGRTSQPPRRLGRLTRGTLQASAKVALGTAAFVQLSQQDNGGTDETAESRMLEASRREIQKTVDDDKSGMVRLGHQFMLIIDIYIWEPICTGFRFLHLLAIFVPAIATVPAIWIGRRQPDRDNERSGALWWYGFLVRAMEWAGPAFIKVRC